MVVVDSVALENRDQMRKPKSAPLSSAPTTAQDQDDTRAPDRRDRHGDRGVPPPLEFDIYALPDSTLLTARDVAAHMRDAVATVQTWTRIPDHPLKWINIPGGFLRTTVGHLKQFLAGGKPRPSLMPLSAHRPKPKPKPKTARRSSRRRTARPTASEPSEHATP